VTCPARVCSRRCSRSSKEPSPRYHSMAVASIPTRNSCRSTPPIFYSSAAALKRILLEPKNALVKQYRRLFEMESVDLTLAEEALWAISRKAIERKTGARGLRSIMEIILLDTMFELPSLEGVEEVVISKQVVEGTAPPLYIYTDRSDRTGNASA